jgi:tetraacyldisaccharide 4'-kinase
MVDQWYLKVLLFPFALLYGLGVTLRNTLYSLGVLKGSVFSIPVISVGNLSVGGTGKTPHTEYLIRILHQYLYLAVLSRGYKRKTSGFLEVSIATNADQCGDEPLQYKRKYPNVTVAVAESRGMAIPQVIRNHPETNVVLLDDGFQHREVKPGLNILLTEYKRLFTRDFFLPVGRLREWKDEAQRADIIIISKCPDNLLPDEKNKLVKEVVQGGNQKVFFSRYRYGHPYKLYEGAQRLPLHPDLTILLVVALAGTDYLLEYLETRVKEVRGMEYSDHHAFSVEDIHDIARQFELIEDKNNAVILTTEKDAMRLDMHRDLLRKLNLPIFILPIAVEFLDENKTAFDEAIKEWLLNFKR